jgi:hypothetical protein
MSSLDSNSRPPSIRQLTTALWGFTNVNVGYRIKVYSDIRYNIGLCALQSDIGGSDIRLSPISLITDIGVSAHLWLADMHKSTTHPKWYICSYFSLKRHRSIITFDPSKGLSVLVKSVPTVDEYEHWVIQCNAFFGFYIKRYGFKLVFVKSRVN